MGTSSFFALTVFSFFCSRSFVLAAMLNETLLVPLTSSNATNLTSELNATHFAEFTVGNFICSGMTTDVSLGDVTASQAIEATIYHYLQGRLDQTSRVPKDSQYVEYSGPEGNLKVTTEFPQESGPLLSIADSAAAINAFIQGIQQQGNLGHHTLQMSIFQQSGGREPRRRLIRIGIEVEQGVTGSIATGNEIHFGGQVYPNRRLVATDLEFCLNEMLQLVRRQGINRPVPSGWQPVVSSRNINIILSFRNSEPSEWPRFIYLNLMRLLQNTRIFFNIKGYSAALVGGIYYGDQNIGTLSIEAHPRPLGPVTSTSSLALNETSVTENPSSDGAVQTS